MESIHLGKYVTRWLAGRILYVGDQILAMDGRGMCGAASEKDIRDARVMVLGKMHYFETIRHFPFTRAKEIKSAVLLDKSDYTPFPSTRCCVRKLHQTGDGAAANIWLISSEAARIMEKQLVSLVIPETALLAFHACQTSRIYEVVLGLHSFLAWIGKNGAVQSVRSGGDVMEVEAFRRVIGKDATGSPVVRITGLKDYAAFLSETIGSLPVNGLYPFINANPYAMTFDSRVLKRGGYSAAALFVIYTILTVSIPCAVEKHLQKEDAAVSAQSVEWIEKQHQIDMAIKKQKALAAPVNAYVSRYQLMRLLQRVVPAETRIIQMAVSGTRVEIRGQAPSATALLTVLSQTQGIQNAQFISPVRKENSTGRDVFALSFEFNGGK